MVSVAHAQSLTISGQVRSAIDNQPLVGVTVHIKAQSQGTVTDSKGHYQLTNVSSSDTLLFSYIGYR